MSTIYLIDHKPRSFYRAWEEFLKMSPVVSTKSESIRFFKTDFCEFFSRVHWSVPLVLYVPLTLYCFYQSWIYSNGSILNLSGFFLLGLLVWSLTEYLLHRFLFHFKPKGERVRRIFYFMHEVHHEYPNDALRLVLPPVESIPLAILLYFGLSAWLPSEIFFPFFSGFLVGYLCYDMIHFSTHHLPLRGKIGQFLKKYHLRHHFQTADRGYGVSSPLWDYVFRTQ